jgi:carbamoyltransferase
MIQPMKNGQKASPIVLGVYLGHDLGACLLANGKIVAAIEEERLNRLKHGRPNEAAGLWKKYSGKFGYFPWSSVSYCLEAGNVSIDDLDAMAIGGMLYGADAENTIRSFIPMKDRKKIIYVTEPKGAVHHLHHALSAFLAAPFDESSVLVVDGDGSFNEEGYEAETGFHFQNRLGDHRQVFKNRYIARRPRSGIGWTYEQVTLLLGFADSRVLIGDPGKTMGLSAYGHPRREFERPWISYNGFNLNYSGFHTWLKESGYDSRLFTYKDGLASRTGEVSQYAKDLAFKVQCELESVMLHLAHEMHRATGSENLCLAGGVALNSVANGVIAERGPFKNIFIQPAANDGGLAIGLAYHGHLLLKGKPTGLASSQGTASAVSKKAEPVHPSIISPIKHAYGGRSYSSEEIRQVLQPSELAFEEFPDDASLAQDAASELVKRSIVGWFQGGSEYGIAAFSPILIGWR